MITFSLKNYIFRLNISPFSITLIQVFDQTTIWQLNNMRIRTLDGLWQKPKEINFREISEVECNLDLIFENGFLLLMKIRIQDPLINFDIVSNNTGVDWIAVDLLAQQDEHFWGFGERFDSIDQRGKQVDLWVEDGAQRDLTYIPVPFYVSSKGYGLFMDTDVKCIARMATPDDPAGVSLRIASPKMKMILMPGNKVKDILIQYTSIAGRPEIPPDWVFGPWKSRDWQTADQSGIQEDVEKQLELNLPATVKLIDARWESAYHTFEFDESKFADPQAMIRHINNNGTRLVLWISPWMAVNNGNDPDDAFNECVLKGYLIKNSKGEVYINQLGLNPMLIGACIDFTNPRAVDWWQEKILNLVKMGVSGFNTDFGEQVPEDAVFYNGLTGREMHNIYPRLYNEITYEAMQLGQPGMLLARAGWHGSQKLSVIWAGDQTSDFSLVSGLRSAIIAGQTAGLSGFPYWTCDIGGYFGTPTDEIYMRWTQFGAFSPVMMIHGAGLREPWAFSDQTLVVYRKYAQLHTDLFPYIQAYAQEASLTGIPIMRAMVLEFPDDPGIWRESVETQYCFGSELLVSPIFYGFSRTRLVYLPDGQWRDYWTGKAFKGGQTVSCPAELDQIPVFAKTGAIIPYLDPSPNTLITAANTNVKCAGNDLSIDIYPGKDGKFRISDGTLFNWNQNEKQFSISNSPLKRYISVRLISEESYNFINATSGGRSLEILHENLNGDQSYKRIMIDHESVTLGFSQ